MIGNRHYVEYRQLGRDVQGPMGGFGIIAKNPGHGKKVRDTIQGRLNSLTEDLKRIQEKSKLDREQYRTSFWASADVHSVISRIKRFIDIGLQAADRDLEKKKNRLKIKLLEEEATLTEEYVDKAQKRAEHEFEKKRKLADEIQSRRADENKSIVEAAYDRIFKESNDSYKLLQQKENRLYINKIHQCQMRDRELRKMKEEEEEKMWNEYLRKLECSRLLSDQVEAERRQMIVDSTKFVLEKQLEGVQRQRENDACLQAAERAFLLDTQKKYKLEEALFQAIENDKEAKYWKDLSEQVELNRALRKRIQEEERHIDRIMQEYNQKELEGQRNRIIDDKVQERLELHLFKESLKQYNDDLAQLEKEVESLIEKKNQEKEMKKWEMNREAMMARRKLRDDCYDSQRKVTELHLKLSEDAKEKAKRELEYETFFCEQNAALEAATAAEILKKRANHNVAMEKQHDYNAVLKQRAMEEAAEELVRQQKKEKDEEIQQERLLGREFSCGTMTHPFSKALMNFYGLDNAFKQS